MNYKTVKAYQKNGQLRSSFNKLSKEVFDLSFENWYKNGFWNEKYIPYSIVIDNEVAANVSVNIIDFVMNGESKQYLQLGTVMTKSEYRNMGYINILMEEIEKDFPKCKGMFLWANDSVTNFYPKFGFEEHKEFRFQKDIRINNPMTAERFKMKNKVHWNSFLDKKSKKRSNGLINLDTDDLLMFYLSQL